MQKFSFCFLNVEALQAMSSTFYRKYRPRIFADVVGQKHIVTTLTNALRIGRVGQAYLFTGPRGTGKTTLARIFAKAVNCEHRKGSEPCGRCTHCTLMDEGRSLDVIEIDAASHTGVDNIRELRETVALPPTVGSHKIYIIDEVHMLSIGAFNALLKTLEEPPAHVIFILATTALHKVPDTIISRCQRFDLSRLSVRDITDKLKRIAKTEKLSIDAGALEMIALAAEGGMRDAESLLMQITTLESAPFTKEKVTEALGATTEQNLIDFLHRIKERDLPGGLGLLQRLSQEGVDMSIFCGALLHFLHHLLLTSANPEEADSLDVPDEKQARSLRLFASFFDPLSVVVMIEHFQKAKSDAKSTIIPELPLQIALVKIFSENGERGTKNVPQTTNEKGQETQNELPKKIEAKTATETNDEKSEAVIDLSCIHDNWQAILDTAKRLNASLTLALSTARPVSTKGTTVTIAVKYPFHKERLEETTNQLTLTEAFDTILGSKTKVRIVLESTSDKRNEVPASSDSFITQALEALGGKLVQEN